MKPFTVLIGIQSHRLSAVIVMAQDSASALLFAVEAAPDAWYISVKAVRA